MTNEVLEKARSAENSEALWALAKENGMELTQEEAESLFERMHRKGELSDEELKTSPAAAAAAQSRPPS